MTFQEILKELNSLGDVLLAGNKSGWWCKCSLNMSKPGTSYEVISDHRHETAEAAAKQCLERITSD